MQNPSKRKALDFLSSGGVPDAQTGVQATKRSPKIDKNPLVNSLNAKNKTTAIEILDFFGSKRTEERLRGSVKRLRNSLVNTFDIAAILKSVIIGITKQLGDAPNKLKGKGGGGLGMIDIARKTGKKLNYDFAPLNDEYTFFSLNINVEENNK